MRGVRLLCIGALAGLLSAGAWGGATYVVGPGTRAVDIQAVEMLPDPGGQLTVAQVSAEAEAGAMQTVTGPKTPLTVTHPEQAVWLRFAVRADPGAPRDMQLEIGRAILNHVQVYYRTEGGAWAGPPGVGAAVPFSARQVDHHLFVFALPVPQAGTLDVLVRVQHPGPSTINLKMWQPAALQAATLITIAIFCLYFGLAFGMLVYVVLLNVVVRDRGYLLYACCVAATATGFAAHSGVGAQFAWGEWPWFNSRGMFFGYGLAATFSVALTRHFLHTRQHLPRIDKVLWVALVLLLAGTVSGAVMPGNVPGLILMPLAVAVPILLLGLAVLAAWRRWPGAPYFLAAWTALHTSVIVLQARHFGLVPENLLTGNIIALGSALEMILLSLALADRINDERRKREAAQLLTLGILQASQALASETRLDRLSARVCEVMAQMTGAASVRFVLLDEATGGWFIFGTGGGGRRMPVDEAAGRGLVMPGALQQAARTHEPVAEGATLYMPVIHHGKLDVVLILERGSGAGAFEGLARDALAAVAGPLTVSLENALLYERLEERVAERTRELQEAQQALVATARRAGMAEIATNVLHNVGNTLNSVNVAAQLLGTRVGNSRVAGLVRAVEMVEAHGSDLAGFLRDDPRGRVLPGYLKELSLELARERADVMAQLSELTASVDHIKNVVAVQQAYVGTSMHLEVVPPAAVVDDALRIAGMMALGSPVTVAVNDDGVEPVAMDKTRVLQILVNLITNARQAMGGTDNAAGAGGRGGHTLTVGIAADEDWIRFVVTDTGCGIDAGAMPSIFSHGFTTRPDGHGFGLHSSAMAARELGGELTAHSDGKGKGATFTLRLPLRR
ncbi:MAG: hypothetical protein EOO28_13160 [Comamonadaceae bacterium]|nr:MAG: hypothetical protein EOO28_13160 [Comamonadaceae bacterium]